MADTKTVAEQIIELVEGGTTITDELYEENYAAAQADYASREATAVAAAKTAINNLRSLLEDHEAACGQLSYAVDLLADANGRKRPEVISSAIAAYLKECMFSKMDRDGRLKFYE